MHWVMVQRKWNGYPIKQISITSLQHTKNILIKRRGLIKVLHRYDEDNIKFFHFLATASVYCYLYVHKFNKFKSN